MKDLRPKCTLIRRLDDSFVVIGPGGREKIEGDKGFVELEAEVIKRGWVISVFHSSLKKLEEV